MVQKSMTALISAFSRAYHCVINSENNNEKVFDDYLAKDILTKEEYQEIADNMSRGISYFNPDFKGTQEEALRWIVDNQLSPSPLGRAAFAERALETAVRIGARQYLIFAAGYDSFAYRQPDWAKGIRIFELDQPVTGEDKQRRIQVLMPEKPSNLYYIPADFTEGGWDKRLMASPAFNKNRISFCSMLGISYYLSRQNFVQMLDTVSGLVPKGSSIVFDYPDEATYTPNAGARVKRQLAMAGAASESMLSAYSYEEMEKLLSQSNFLIYEHLTPAEITRQYFSKYNKANPEHAITAFDNVNYCLAVKE